MHPRLFTIPSFHLLGAALGPYPVPTYGLLIAIAFLAGLYVVSKEAQREGLDAERLTDLALYVLIAGIVGARLLLLGIDWRFYLEHKREILPTILQSGGVFYGGLLLAIPVAWWYTRKHHLDGWRTADVLAPGIVIGQAIGRLGCLAAGCCYGKDAHVPWAITYRDVYAARLIGTPLDRPVHPTQIYESIACFLIFAILLWIGRHKKFPGQVALCYFLFYSVTRFVVEFYRGDLARGFPWNGPLSTSQVIAIPLALGAASWLFVLSRKGRQPAGQGAAA
jgi:phosphatidylglycerol:prolipoprotein diacylglycerol transferase